MLGAGSGAGWAAKHDQIQRSSSKPETNPTRGRSWNYPHGS